jgi:hypothetical protein
LAVIFWVLVASSLVITIRIVIPAFVEMYRAYRRQKPSKRTLGKLSNLIEVFNEGTNGAVLGEAFVGLLKFGFHRIIKTINHSNNFPDEAQYNGFVRFSTKEIMQSLFNLGAKY